MDQFQQFRETELDPLKGSLQKQKPKSNEDWYHFYSLQLIAFYQMYQRVNLCLDFSNNPQKLPILKSLLELIISKIVQIKSSMRKLYDFHTCIGDQYLPIQAALRVVGVTPEEIRLEAPKFLKTEEGVISQ